MRVAQHPRRFTVGTIKTEYLANPPKRQQQQVDQTGLLGFFALEGESRFGRRLCAIGRERHQVRPFLLFAFVCDTYVVKQLLEIGLMIGLDPHRSELGDE